MRTETRPWGRFEVISESETNWFKRIFIAPGQSLSYQYHLRRSEFWLAETPGVFAELNGKTMQLRTLSHNVVAVWPRIKHRLYNPGDVEVSVLEWAVGRPEESDIVRLRDDYGR